MKTNVVVTVIATVGAVRPADARQVAPPAASSSAIPDSPPSSSAPKLEGYAWDDYHAAFRLLMSRTSGGARDLLRSLQSGRTSHPAAIWAGRVLSALDRQPTTPPTAAEDEVWLSYHTAFELLARQQEIDAATRLRAIAERRDGHPASAKAVVLLEAASKAQAVEQAALQEKLLPITYKPWLSG